MKQGNLFQTELLVALIVAVLLCFCSPAAWSQGWERLGDESGAALEGGGVGHDMQFLVPAASGNYDTLWSACMNSGIYRATWNSSTSLWNDWVEYMPGTGFLGVDAIEVDETEYVLAAGGGGVWYGSSPLQLTPWPRPNAYYYPDDWEWTRVHDVAFYWPTDPGTPTDPEGEYFVILRAQLLEPTRNPGIYRWTGASPDYFSRVDETQSHYTAHSYFRFYRDIDTPNVLYITSSECIYKISGPYHKPTFEALPVTVHLEDLPITTPTTSQTEKIVIVR